MLKKLLNNIIGIKHLYIYIVIYVLTYIPIILYPLESDHWIYTYVAKKFTSGIPIYTQIFDNNSPTLYLFNSIFLLLGESIWNTRFLLIFFSIFSLIGFYKLANISAIYLKLFDNEKSNYVIISTVIYIFLTNMSFIYGSGNSPEALALPFLIWAIYLYFYNKFKRDLKVDLLIGLLWGVIITLNPIWISIGILVLFDFIQATRRAEIKFNMWAFTSFTFGIILLPLFWIYYFYLNNSFYDFYVATLEYNFKFIIAAWAGYVSSAVRVLIQASIVFSLLIYTFSISGINKILDENMFTNKLLRFIFGFLIVGSFIWFLSGTFFSIYLLAIIPALSLIIAYWMFDYNLDFSLNKNKYFGIYLIIFVFASLTISVMQIFGFSFSNTNVNNLVNASNYINSKTSSLERVAQYGYGASLYSLAQRDSVSKYFNSSVVLLDSNAKMGYNLSEAWLKDIENYKVKYILTTPDYETNYKKEESINRYLTSYYAIDKKYGGYYVWLRK